MAATFDVRQYLSRAELRSLSRRSDVRGAAAVLTTLGMIGGSFALVAAAPHPGTVALALLIIGTRQLALGVLMHEAAHRTLFRTQWLNEWVGQWICSVPLWADLRRYRWSHLKHHADNATTDDPDLVFVTLFPMAGERLLGKFARDLLGVTAAYRVAALLLTDLGFIEYSVSGVARPLDQRGRRLRDLLGAAWRNLRGVLLTNAALLGAFIAVGRPELYLLWVGAWATVFNAAVRVRTIVEHGGTGDPGDALRNTRTTLGGPVDRLLVAPHEVNYHLEHHLLMGVPFFQLPRLHRLLKERKALEGAWFSPSCFAALWSEVIAGRCQPRTFGPAARPWKGNKPGPQAWEPGEGGSRLLAWAGARVSRLLAGYNAQRAAERSG